MSDFKENVTFEITSGTIVKTVFIVAGLFLLYFLRDIVLIILMAIVFASAIEPATKWLVRRGIPRVFSVVILYFLIALLVVGVFYVFVPVLIQDTSNFLSNVPQYIDSVSLWTAFGKEGVRVSEVATGLSSGLAESRGIVSDLGSNLPINETLNNISNAVSNISSGFVKTVNTVFGGAVGFVLIVVLSFYLAVQEDGVDKFLRIITPLKHEKYVLGLWKRSREKIGLWMQGQIMLVIIVGVLVYLGLTILGVRNALLFAVLAGLFEIIPLFGPLLAAVPAVATAYADSGMPFALIVVGLYLIIQQFENHLIYPLVVKKIMGVPPILVILALIVGFKLAGFLGLILSVPLTAMLVEFLDDIQRSRTAQS